eukprot:448394-Hanusia_phi.AAC.4
MDRKIAEEREKADREIIRVSRRTCFRPLNPCAQMKALHDAEIQKLRSSISHNTPTSTVNTSSVCVIS